MTELEMLRQQNAELKRLLRLAVEDTKRADMEADGLQEYMEDIDADDKVYDYIYDKIDDIVNWNMEWYGKVEEVLRDA